jgi:hypothetical protein
LEEALEMEFDQPLCIGVTDLLRCAKAGEYYIRDMYTLQQRHKRLIILGRSITFDDILSLIFVKTKNVVITGITKTSSNVKPLVQIKIHDVNGLYYFNYTFTEELEKQSSKTLKIIATFID